MVYVSIVTGKPLLKQNLGDLCTSARACDRVAMVVYGSIKERSGWKWSRYVAATSTVDRSCQLHYST